MTSEQVFDEKAQAGLRKLIESYWILRQTDSESYRLIRERERVIRRFVDEKLGLQLYINQHLIKLEKIPIEPKRWMGMNGFQETRDYVIFCCALAFTESMAIEEQFLLSDICEEIVELYPGDFPLDWTNYNHRRALVRVIKQMEELMILHKVEGEIEKFMQDEEMEVLYEVSVHARYFMRTYPKEIHQYDSVSELLESEWEGREDGERRKRVYRKLLFTPVVYRENDEDSDFDYIRKYRNRLSEDLAIHTNMRLELFKNAAMLVTDERKQEYTLFPDQKALSNVMLHFATSVREQLDELMIDEQGNIRLSRVLLEQMMSKVYDQYKVGWSKQYREQSIQLTTKEMIEQLLAWDMLLYSPELDIYMIRPLLGRIIGVYPADFLSEVGGELNAKK